MSKDTSKYISLYWAEKDNILSGRYPAGSMLPTEAELMEKHNASRTTVRKAIKLLANDGLVESRQGKGTIVIGKNSTVSSYNYLSIGSKADVRSRFKNNRKGETSSQKAVIDKIPAAPEVATALKLNPGDTIYRLQRVKMIDNTVFSYIISYVPLAVAPGLEQYDGEILFLYKFLNEKYGIEFEGSQDVISSEPADFILSRILNVPTNTPILTSKRIAFTKGEPFEYSESMLVGSMMEIVISSTAISPTAYIEE